MDYNLHIILVADYPFVGRCYIHKYIHSMPAALETTGNKAVAAGNRIKSY
jgi:hypothetical protein